MLGPERLAARGSKDIRYTMRRVSIAAVAVILLAVLLFVAGREGDTTSIETPGRHVSSWSGMSGPAPELAEETQAQTRRSEARTSVETADAQQQPRPENDLASSRTVEGRVVDLLATPVSGVAVLFQADGASQPSKERARSDANGDFRIRVPDQLGVLRTDSTSWVAVFEPRIQPEKPDAANLMVVARARSLRGQVVDESGLPVGGARVTIELEKGWYFHDRSWGGPDNELRATFPLSLEDSSTARWATTSDPQGQFELPNAPQIPKSQLETQHEGFETDRRAVPATGDEFTIVLRRPVEPMGHLRGKVQDPQGRAIESAWVCMGSRQTRTDARGAFDLNLGDRPDGDALVAFHEQWMPVVQPCLAASPLATNAWPEPLVLTFEKNTLTIEGRVVDAKGGAIEGCMITTLDPVTVSEIFESCGMQVPKSVRGAEVLGGTEVWTDAGGAFVMKGLLPRAYRLHAQERRTLNSVTSEPFSAGTIGVTLRIDAKGTYPCIAGRVIHADGSPLADMRVQARQKATDHEVTSDEVRTDPDGRFRVEGLSKDADSLVVLVDKAPSRIYRIADQADPCALVLVVPRHGDLLVQVSDAFAAAQRFAVLGADGTRLIMAKHFPGGSQGPFETLPIENGTSSWAIVPDDAVTILLLQGKQELHRAPLRVIPGERTVVRF